MLPFHRLEAGFAFAEAFISDLGDEAEKHGFRPPHLLLARVGLAWRLRGGMFARCFSGQWVVVSGPENNFVYAPNRGGGVTMVTGPRRLAALHRIGVPSQVSPPQYEPGEFA